MIASQPSHLSAVPLPGQRLPERRSDTRLPEWRGHASSAEAYPGARCLPGPHRREGLNQKPRKSEGYYDVLCSYVHTFFSVSKIAPLSVPALRKAPTRWSIDRKSV